MAKSPAERQRELRARRSRARVGDVPARDRSEGEARLDIWVRINAVLALKRIAKRRGLSQRLALEQVLLEADAAGEESALPRHDIETLPGNSAKALAEKFRAADWNKIVAPACFTAKGLADLGELIQAHGIDAVSEAVHVLLAKSKTDRTIRRGHVRSWRFFGPAINEQQTKEPVL